MNVSLSIEDALSSRMRCLLGFRVTVGVPLRLQSATTTQSKENSDSITGRFGGGELGTQLGPPAGAHTRQKRARLMTSCTVIGRQGTLCFQTAVSE